MKKMYIDLRPVHTNFRNAFVCSDQCVKKKGRQSKWICIFTLIFRKAEICLKNNPFWHPLVTETSTKTLWFQILLLLFTAFAKYFVCYRHQVVVLCNSRGSGHVTQSANIFGWPIFFAVGWNYIRTPLRKKSYYIALTACECQSQSEQTH